MNMLIALMALTQPSWAGDNQDPYEAETNLLAPGSAVLAGFGGGFILDDGGRELLECVRRHTKNPDIAQAACERVLRGESPKRAVENARKKHYRTPKVQGAPVTFVPLNEELLSGKVPGRVSSSRLRYLLGPAATVVVGVELGLRFWRLGLPNRSTDDLELLDLELLDLELPEAM